MRFKRMTPNHSRALCETCKFAMMAKGMGESQMMVRCKVMDTPIPWPIAECSEYEVTGSLTLYELEKMAYIIETNKTGIGFHIRRLTDKEIT